jgi:AmmeMemoRadiSam system protein A
MSNQTSCLVFSGIAPHPPIMVPEVGRESIAEVRHSIAAMAELTERLIVSGATSVILISPHAPLESDSFVAYDGSEVYGDFANFHSPETSVSARVDRELLAAITNAAAAENYTISNLADLELDHGTAVPLYFLLRNGWQGSVVALGYSFLSNDDHLRFGACIKRAVDSVTRPIGFIASGDLSHRLAPHAPAGFNPNAHFFDERVVAALQDNKPCEIVEIDHSLRRLAGECGYRSMLVAIGAGTGLPPACEVLNYEAPFGVGYLVAQLINQRAETKTDDLPALARTAVETFIRSGNVPELGGTQGELLSARAPCFVSLKTLDGELRGCIGTIEPAKETLADEIVANAISAAINDPRFDPVSEDELANLRYSVDVLLPAEETVLEELDPAVFGVIVEDENGSRRGLLLPDIPGVESVEHQVEIAARKAGIPHGTPVKLWRFRVERFPEKNRD